MSHGEDTTNDGIPKNHLKTHRLIELISKSNEAHKESHKVSEPNNGTFTKFHFFFLAILWKLGNSWMVLSGTCIYSVTLPLLRGMLGYIDDLRLHMSVTSSHLVFKTLSSILA